ncbi:hypothetical protein JYU20_00125 [Bacteroidales bacterium AH-315-I05]|nr:hypothetical protein [Bacteroidales bacterium AH-315-I05]
MGDYFDIFASNMKVSLLTIVALLTITSALAQYDLNGYYYSKVKDDYNTIHWIHILNPRSLRQFTTSEIGCATFGTIDYGQSPKDLLIDFLNHFDKIDPDCKKTMMPTPYQKLEDGKIAVMLRDETNKTTRTVLKLEYSILYRMYKNEKDKFVKKKYKMI